MSSSLGDIFGTESAGAVTMTETLRDPDVSQIVVNRHDRITVTRYDGQVVNPSGVFASGEDYKTWLNELLTYTDAGLLDIRAANSSVVEASFNPALIPVYGSIHIATEELTQGDPCLTVRKQPREVLTLDQLVTQGALSPEMAVFLEYAVRGRLNILLSGGSGAGKTTLARALAMYIDPSHRVLTCEEIRELHLDERLHNAPALTTYRSRDEQGRLIREATLEDIVKEGLRMRPDRVWIGEVRGREAYSLIKAANSGHDGCVTTVHADNAQQAMKTLITYVMEAGLPAEVALEHAVRGFPLVVQLTKGERGSRRITEITEFEPVVERAGEPRRNPLYVYDGRSGAFLPQGAPSERLVDQALNHNTNLGDLWAAPAGY